MEKIDIVTPVVFVIISCAAGTLPPYLTSNHFDYMTIQIEKNWQTREDNVLTGKSKISSGRIKVLLKENPAESQLSRKKRK